MADYDKFFEILSDITNEPGGWRDKKDKLLEAASKDDVGNIEELVGWFEEGQ